MRRMSKTTGNKVNVDKNSSFARFALSRKYPIRQKEKSFWFTGYLVSIGTNIKVTLMILFFLHSNYLFFCVPLETLVDYNSVKIL